MTPDQRLRLVAARLVAGLVKMPDEIPAAAEKLVRYIRDGIGARRGRRGIFGRVNGAGHDTTQRRFQAPPARSPSTVIVLPETHRALLDATTVYRRSVRDVTDGEPVLKSGHNNAKIGSTVAKGFLKGAPIHYLTLEERATCPRSCAHWGDCYGNAMPLARRYRHGPALEAKLGSELAALQAKHPGGFLVRLHVLGDFYSADYVRMWWRWIERFPALHVYGYTAWPSNSPMGQLILGLADSSRWGRRFMVRQSGADRRHMAANVIDYVPDGPRVTEGLVCPAETGRTDCCATCGLCWNSGQNIVFIRHGRQKRGSRREAA